MTEEQLRRFKQDRFAGLYEEPDADKETVESPYLYGFGGWLRAYAIGQIIMVYLSFVDVKDWFSFISSDDIRQLNESGYGDVATRIKLLGVVGLVHSLIVILLIFISWYFAFRLSRMYKKANLIYILTNCIGVLSICLFALYLNDYVGETLFEFTDVAAVLFSAILFGVIWIPYFLFSVRIQNTFIK